MGTSYPGNRSRQRHGRGGWFTRATALLALSAALLWSAPASAASDPKSVVDQLDATVNAGDVAGALALFAPDAQVHQTPAQPGTNGAYQGTEQVRAFLQSIVNQHIHLELATPRQVNGNEVTWTNNTSNDAWRKLGVAPLQGLGDAVVTDGLITSLTITLTPESLAKLKAATSSTPGMPNTGAGGTASTHDGAAGHWELLAGLAAAGLLAVVGTVGYAARRARLI